MAVMMSVNLVTRPFSILCCLLALMGSISTALEINLPNQTRNFNEAKWLMVDAVTFFITGTLGTGFAIILVKGHDRKADKDSNQ
jgi:hypothetical protein